MNLNKSSREREIFCIKLDYLPIWLAKISITPTMKKDHPELADKLLEYQLKAKDILVAAFLPQQDMNFFPNEKSSTIDRTQTEYISKLDTAKEMTMMEQNQIRKRKSNI